jgi:RNA polymerase sigma-70 factor (ECF subfamily)
MRQSADRPNPVPLVQTFDAFYRREYRSVVALAVVLSGSRWAAEDLAQEAFSAAYREWGRVSTYEFPNLWVRRVVANKAVSLIRRSVAEAKARARIGAGHPPLDEMPDEAEGVWDEVRRLPKRQTQAIALVYLDGLSVNEAGIVMDCSEATVKTHLQRGRQTLGRRLETEWRLVHDA